jgi:hypothetical protein
MTDAPDPPPGIAPLASTAAGVSGASGTLTRTEFRDVSVAACRAALARLVAITGTGPRDIFAATAEVLFWLYTLADIDTRNNQMQPGLRWVRGVHAHGRLFTEATYYDPGAKQHRWLTRANITTRANAQRSVYCAAEYDAHNADQPVIGTLRAEVDRLAALTGSTA